MKPSVLFVAFHYPPIQMSSGVHRTVAFSRFLAIQGADVAVLTVNPKAYSHTNKAIQTPKDVSVLRCFALDTARHLTIKGRYLGLFAQPDRWISWLPTGVLKGYRHLRSKNNSVIISTYPIATAHIIGYLLHRLTGQPWIADLRDPMLQDNYPADNFRRNIFRWIERKIIKHANAAILTSPGAIDLYRQRYPEVPSDFWHYIPNGFDETLFADLPVWTREQDGRFTLLHSGTIYPKERDPSALFNAIRILKQQHPAMAAKLRLVLRATGHDELYQQQLRSHDIADIVELAPAIDYRNAAAEMLSADALLLMQAADCNYQTPAKAYEYIRAGKPVLVLAPYESDSWHVMEQTGISQRADLDNADAIFRAIMSLMTQSTVAKLTDIEIAAFSREHGARVLEKIITSVR